ncbi:Acylphosphatase [compost metagenome]
MRNLPDGDVELEAQGTDDQVAALVAWCHHGPSLAKVTSVQVEDLPPASGEVPGFEIRR